MGQNAWRHLGRIGGRVIGGVGGYLLGGLSGSFMGYEAGAEVTDAAFPDKEVEKTQTSIAPINKFQEGYDAGYHPSIVKNTSFLAAPNQTFNQIAAGSDLVNSTAMSLNASGAFGDTSKKKTNIPKSTTNNNILSNVSDTPNMVDQGSSLLGTQNLVQNNFDIPGPNKQTFSNILNSGITEPNKLTSQLVNETRIKPEGIYSQEMNPTSIPTLKSGTTPTLANQSSILGNMSNNLMVQSMLNRYKY